MTPVGRDDRVGRFWVADQPEIDRPLLYHSIDFVGMGQVIIHRRSGASFGKLVLEGRQVGQSHRVDRGDHHMASDSGRGVISGADLFNQGVKLAQNRRKSIEELLAFGRHDKRAFGSIDELDAEKFLEVLDALARGALGHAMLDCRMRKASLADHIVEDLERSNVDSLTGRLFICFANFGSPSIKIRHPGYRFESDSSRLGHGA